MMAMKVIWRFVHICVATSPLLVSLLYAPASAQTQNNPLIMATYPIALLDSSQAPKECQEYHGAWGDGHWTPSKNHLEVWITKVEADCSFLGRIFWAPENLRPFVRPGSFIKGTINPQTSEASFPIENRTATMKVAGGVAEMESYPTSSGKAEPRKIAKATLKKLVLPEQQKLGEVPVPFNLNISKERLSGCSDLRGVWVGGWEKQPAATFIEHIQKINGVCEVIFVYSVGAVQDRTDIVATWVRASGVLEGSTLKANGKIFDGTVQYAFLDAQVKLWWNNAEAKLSKTPFE